MANIDKALAKSHGPAARAKASATIMKLTKMRHKLAKQYSEKPQAFGKASIFDTIKRHEINLNSIPDELLKNTMGKRALAELRNGAKHAKGVGIPLDAIPERKIDTRSSAYKNAARDARVASKRGGHPNSELLGKVIDLIAHPDTDKHTGKRLLVVLDKLLAL